MSNSDAIREGREEMIVRNMAVGYRYGYEDALADSGQPVHPDGSTDAEAFATFFLTRTGEVSKKYVSLRIAHQDFEKARVASL